VAEEIDQTPDDREAEPHASGRARFAPLPGGEESFSLGRVDARAAVADLDVYLVAATARGQQHASCLRVADGVHQQVLEDGVKQQQVAAHAERRAAHAQLEALLRGQWLHRGV
jgi:hypothetical protein